MTEAGSGPGGNGGTSADDPRANLIARAKGRIDAYRSGHIGLEELVNALTGFAELYDYIDEEAANRFRINMWDVIAASEMGDDESDDVRHFYGRRIDRALTILEELLLVMRL